MCPQCINIDATSLSGPDKSIVWLHGTNKKFCWASKIFHYFVAEVLYWTNRSNFDLSSPDYANLKTKTTPGHWFNIRCLCNVYDAAVMLTWCCFNVLCIWNLFWFLFINFYVRWFHNICPIDVDLTGSNQLLRYNQCDREQQTLLKSIRTHRE